MYFVAYNYVNFNNYKDFNPADFFYGLFYS